MKKVKLFLLLFISTVSLYSQEVTQKDLYEFSVVKFLDKDNNIIEQFEYGGLIMFVETQGVDFIAVTIGNGDPSTLGEIKQSKIEETIDGIVKVYLAVVDFQGVNVPIQVYEYYDYKKSKITPQLFNIDIHNSQTGELVQRQIFEGIKRIDDEQFKKNDQDLDVEYKYKDNESSIAVIEPTIRNFIYLLTLDESQFEMKMKQYKYFEQPDDGKYRWFWNGSITNFMNDCVNSFYFNVMRDEIRFMVDHEMIYPSGIITQLFRDLKPYFIGSKSNDSGHNIDAFAFNLEGFTYKFYVTNTGSFYDIVVIKESIDKN